MADNPTQAAAKRGAVFTNRPELKGKENVVFTPDYDYWVSGKTKGGAPQPEPGSMRPEFTDINEFENHVHEIIGGNPLEINPIDDANSAMEDLPNYFNQIFKGVAIWQDRDKLGPKHAAIWQQFVNAYRSKVYNESKQRKAQMMDMKNAMMNKFKYNVDAYNKALKREEVRAKEYKADMVWIHSKEQNVKKKVHRSLLDKYVNQGWVEGLPIKSEKEPQSEGQLVAKEVRRRIVNIRAGKEDKDLINEFMLSDDSNDLDISYQSSPDEYTELARKWKINKLRAGLAKGAKSRVPDIMARGKGKGKSKGKKAVRRGTYKGRKIIQYDDGSAEYAD